MKLAAIVLAAGASIRFGGDKLTVPFRGEPLVRHAIRAARAAPVERVIVVASPGLAIGEWRGEPPVHAVRIVSDALSQSLKAGIAAAGTVDGAFVFLGDMPLVPHGLAAALAEAMGDNFAAVPRHDGHNGHPVLLSRRSFAAVARLEGDAGAGRLISAHSDIAFVTSEAETIHLDIDRPADLRKLESR